MAGSLKAKYGLPLPDMFQVAAALAQPANAIITNDRDIQRVRETDVFLLSDLVTRKPIRDFLGIVSANHISLTLQTLNLKFVPYIS